MKMPGRVYLVGAGPGDPELLTLKAANLLAVADVIVFDRLVSPEILAFANPQARRIPVGKEPRRHPVPQSEINRILVREARAGHLVVRLKGGDPFVFGRGSEEALALRAAGLRCDVVPGITAAQGCAAATGVPLTHRGLATSVRFITGHCRADEPLDFDWDGLADPATTLVIYMGAANIAEIATRLQGHGRDPDTPVMAINNGTRPDERRLVSRLADIAITAADASFAGPVVFIVGDVVALYGDSHMSPALQSALATANDVSREAAPYA
ncbi:MAG: uroporphyrinogen-III C-methyltransferase [Hyphomicrobiaceae bacterium]|nr:uroporphyrinogen-III C-methyltransferase [Hyphomicrobiaceae bacterium]